MQSKIQRDAKDFLGNHKAKTKGMPRVCEQNTRQNTKGMLGVLKENTKQHAKEMLRIPSKLQNKIQRKCQWFLVKCTANYKGNGKGFRAKYKAEIRQML